ncbi:hypothetical protein MSAN_01376300 [Mycena sanguinolenta]|uniref:Uncharacterized protein n=1 Tax=Mycena sanguinolenta TaxID=230812 RepID=A0A8H7D0W7_9AGAR|nr:hypothetical protein MSAN_01376300 [Mycena sanguinolenta]
MFKLPAARHSARRLQAASKPLERQLYTLPVCSRAVSITRLQGNILQRQCIRNLPSRLNICPSYSTLPQGENKAQNPQTDDDRALALLEGISQQILSYTLPADESDRLRISYSLIYEMTRYLARHGDDSAAYLSVFMNSEAPPWLRHRPSPEVRVPIDGICCSCSLHNSVIFFAPRGAPGDI